MSFSLLHTDSKTKARAGVLQTAHGEIETPIFMPVGTAATVKGVHKDFLEKQSNYRELLPLGIDGHFNINGYKKITEFIYNSIQKIN